MSSFNDYLKGLYSSFELEALYLNTIMEYFSYTPDDHSRSYIPQYSLQSDLDIVPVHSDLIIPFPHDEFPNAPSYEIEMYYSAERIRCLDKNQLSMLNGVILISFCKNCLPAYQSAFGFDKRYIYPFLTVLGFRYLDLDSCTIFSSLPYSPDSEIYFIGKVYVQSTFGGHYGMKPGLAFHHFQIEVFSSLKSFGSFFSSLSYFQSLERMPLYPYPNCVGDAFAPFLRVNHSEDTTALSHYIKNNGQVIDETSSVLLTYKDSFPVKISRVTDHVLLLLVPRSCEYDISTRLLDTGNGGFVERKELFVKNINFEIFLYYVPDSLVDQSSVRDAVATFNPLLKNCCLAECFGITE